MMISRFLVVAGVLGILASCAGGPKLAHSHEVIEMKKAGTDDATLLDWVSDPSRTFDLTDAEIADLTEAGISEDVMSVMVRKSEEHHEKGGGHEHEKKHDH